MMKAAEMKLMRFMLTAVISASVLIPAVIRLWRSRNRGFDACIRKDSARN
jgi:hypothetical protein